MYGIEVREREEQGITVELRGEFDLNSLEDLRSILDGVLGLRQPTRLDLSGVTFMDLLSTRELAVQAQLYGHYLTFSEPSPQVTASIRACGLEDWFGFPPERPEVLDLRRAS